MKLEKEKDQKVIKINYSTPVAMRRASVALRELRAKYKDVSIIFADANKLIVKLW